MWCGGALCCLALPVHFRQQPEDYRPRRLVFLQVDQQLPEGPRRGRGPELADPPAPREGGSCRDATVRTCRLTVIKRRGRR